MAGFNAKAVIGALFAITLGIIFTVNLVAPQITGIFDTNTTGWDVGTAALYAVLGIVVVAVVVYLFLRMGGVV